MGPDTGRAAVPRGPDQSAGPPDDPSGQRWDAEGVPTSRGRFAATGWSQRIEMGPATGRAAVPAALINPQGCGITRRSAWGRGLSGSTRGLPASGFAIGCPP